MNSEAVDQKERDAEAAAVSDYCSVVAVAAAAAVEQFSTTRRKHKGFINGPVNKYTIGSKTDSLLVYIHSRIWLSYEETLHMQT